MFLHSVNLWNLAFYALMVFMATLGLWDVFFGFEENKCSMSYMFEYPEYQVRFRFPFTRALRASSPSILPLLCVFLPRLRAPLPPTHPKLASAFSSPEDFAVPRGPLLLPFVSCLYGGIFDIRFPEHPSRSRRGGSPDPPSPSWSHSPSTGCSEGPGPPSLLSSRSAVPSSLPKPKPHPPAFPP